MSALYGRLQGNRGMATRCGTPASGMFTSAETWNGAVRVQLESDGSFVIEIGPKYGGHDHVGGTIVLTGNVGDNGRNCYLRKHRTGWRMMGISEYVKQCVKCIKRSK